MSRTAALSAVSAGAPLERPRSSAASCANDVVIDIAFAGICHSDIHQAREEWGRAIFPMVPGHEIAGIVTEVGTEVTTYTGRRPRRRRLLRRLLPRVRELQGRRGAVLPQGRGRRPTTARTTTASPPSAATHQSVVVDENYVAQHPRRRRARRRRAAALRRHHAVLPAQPLGRRPRQEGRHRRHGRPGPHGRQDRRRHRRRGDRAVARRPPRRRTARKFGAEHYYATSDEETFEELARHLRPDRQHGSRQPADRQVPRAARPQRHHGQRRHPRATRQTPRLLPRRHAPPHGRLQDRWHPRDPGDARLLRPSTASAPRSRRSAPTRSTRPTTASSTPTCATASSSTRRRSAPDGLTA